VHSSVTFQTHLVTRWTEAKQPTVCWQRNTPVILTQMKLYCFY